MRLPISNHVTISENGITIDGTPLLVEEDSVIITGYDDRNEPTKVMLTLIPAEVTIKQLGSDLSEEGDGKEATNLWDSDALAGAPSDGVVQWAVGGKLEDQGPKLSGYAEPLTPERQFDILREAADLFDGRLDLPGFKANYKITMVRQALQDLAEKSFTLNGLSNLEGDDEEAVDDPVPAPSVGTAYIDIKPRILPVDEEELHKTIQTIHTLGMHIAMAKS